MEISNTAIYGLEFAFRCMRFPMKSTGKSDTAWDFNCSDIPYKDIIEESEDSSEVLVVGLADKKVATHLGQCPSGSGHDSFLKGIVVEAEFKANHAFWLQESRYHHIDIISLIIGRAA